MIAKSNHYGSHFAAPKSKGENQWKPNGFLVETDCQIQSILPWRCTYDPHPFPETSALPEAVFAFLAVGRVDFPSLCDFGRGLLFLLRGLQRPADPLLSSRPRLPHRRSSGLGLGDGPGQRFCGQLFLLPFGQPLFLAFHAPAHRVGALCHGASADAEVCRRSFNRLRLSEAVHQAGLHRCHRGAALRLFRVPDLQCILQPLPRGGDRLSAADCHGGNHD